MARPPSLMPFACSHLVVTLPSIRCSLSNLVVLQASSYVRAIHSEVIGKWGDEIKKVMKVKHNPGYCLCKQGLASPIRHSTWGGLIWTQNCSITQLFSCYRALHSCRLSTNQFPRSTNHQMCRFTKNEMNKILDGNPWEGTRVLGQRKIGF